MKNERIKMSKIFPKGKKGYENHRFSSHFFPKGKKGINDISILSIILIIFLSTALIIPFVNDEFEQNYDEFDVEGNEQSIRDSANPESLSAVGVLKNVLALAFWDFGNTLSLPWWLDAVFSILAILFILIIARNIWVGGGG